MKKLILAISGVFCLQLGFIGYHSSDPSAETSFLVVDERATEISLVDVAQPPSLPKTVADVEPESIDEAPVLAPIERTSDIRPIYAPQAARHIARKRPALNTFVTQNTAEDLRPVNVTYQLHQGVEFKTLSSKPRTEYPRTIADQSPRSYELSAKVAPRQKKKGFFAKSLRIVKKPYDWLKAVGSALK